MNNQIKERIDAELPPGGMPVRLDVETVMASSRQRRMRQRLMGGGAAVASIVAVAAMVLSVMTLAPGGGDQSPDDAADTTKTEVDKDEPVLDPDKDHYWEFANGPDYKNEITGVTEAYTDAFWKYFTKNHPTATFIDGNGQGSQNRQEHTGDPAEDGFFGTQTFLLYEGNQIDNFGDTPDPVREREILTMFERSGPGKGFNGTGCCGLQFLFEGNDTGAVHLGIEVYPKGSFTKGTEDGMDPAFFGDDVDHDIDTDAGPGGDIIQTVAASTTGDAAEGTVDTLRYAVIVYRADGTAIVMQASSGADGSDDVGDYLSFDDMRGIALALPDVPLS